MVKRCGVIWFFDGFSDLTYIISQLYSFIWEIHISKWDDMGNPFTYPVSWDDMGRVFYTSLVGNDYTSRIISKILPRPSEFMLFSCEM